MENLPFYFKLLAVRDLSRVKLLKHCTSQGCHLQVTTQGALEQLWINTPSPLLANAMTLKRKKLRVSASPSI